MTLSRLQRGITSKKKDNYCINCLNSFRTEKKPKSHENVNKIHDYCHVKIPEKLHQIHQNIINENL